MNAYSQPQAPTRRLVGLAVVALLHVALFYALLSGLARDVVQLVKKPLDTKVIVELPTLPPPPPPPPPKEMAPKLPPKAEVPPPAYVPPPDVPVVSPAPPPIVAVESAPLPAAVEVRPAFEVAAPKPERLTIEGSCPGHAEALRRAFAGLYDRVGVDGTVVVRVQVRGTAISKVNVLSGPREYHRAVTTAVQGLRCEVSGGGEGWFELPIVFREQ